MSSFALPSVFRASALAVTGDPWIPDGVHLRVRVWNELGFPIHPFAAWQLGDFSSDLVSVTWNGKVATTNDCDWVFFNVALGGDGTVHVLDRVLGPFGDRVVATRTGPPYAFGGPGLSRIMVDGAPVNQIVGVRASGLPVPTRQPPSDVFGLPIPDGPWYAAQPDPVGSAKERIDNGRRLRFGPADPDQAGNPVPGGHDVERILTSIAPDHVDGWLGRGWQQSAAPPMTVRRSDSQTVGAGRQASTIGVVDGLLTMALDPLIARYLGLATTVRPQYSMADGQSAIWVVAAQWLVQPNRIILPSTGTPFRHWLGDGVADPAMTAVLDAAFPQAAAVKDQAAAMSDQLPPDQRWEPITLMTFAVAAVGAPPDPPSAPALALQGPGSWNPGQGGDQWTQAITLLGPPPSGQVAFVRVAPGATTSLHRQIDGEAVALAPALGAGGLLLTDTAVPADAGGAAWEITYADEFGRWGQPNDVSAVLPPRPAPPPPVVELHITPAADDPDRGLRSAGTLTVRIGPPALAPGSHQVKAVEVDLDGAAAGSFPVPLLQDFPLPALQVGASSTISVRARFVSVDGLKSSDGSASSPFQDPRSPVAIRSAPTLLFTARPGPDGNAEVALRWQPVAGASGYRIYLGDEPCLARALHLPLDTGGTRADRAAAIWARGGELADKSQFSLIEEVVAPTTECAALLPGAPIHVQFLRIVPLSAGQREAPFHACGLVPVAVPSAERPPAPTLRVSAQPDGHIEVTVNGQGAEVRIRRTASLNVEARYTPIVASGPLGMPLPDGPLPPFTRVTYLAEVRYAAESAVATGTTAPAPDPLSVQPVWQHPGDPHRALWSQPSLPASVVIVPDPPAAPAGATAVRDTTGTVTITLPNPPVTAVPYRLCAFRRTTGLPIAPLPPTDIHSAPHVMTDLPPAGTATSDLSYTLILTDPLDRESPPATIPPQ